jgi:hypothetical protein
MNREKHLDPSQVRRGEVDVKRPGIPMERHPATPLPFGRPLGPVRSSAVPLRGLSGLVRHAAYRTPEHRARHWFLLLLGDRVDAVEHRPWFYPALAVGTLLLGRRLLGRR